VPDIVLKKVDLALNYNVKTIRNHLFAFVDLRDGENLEELKRTLKNENLALYEFKADSVLLQLTRRFPYNYKLIKALGDFYYDTYTDMGDRWFISAKELLKKFYRYYKTAYDHGVYDAMSLYAVAFYYSVFENYDEAEKWYDRSRELDPFNPLVAYGAGVNQLMSRHPADGIVPMKIAYDFFTDSLKKSDAARVLGIMYYKTGKEHKAYEMFRIADSLSPLYHPNQMFLLRSQLQLGKQEPALELAKVIFDQAPVDPDVPDELLEMFRMEGEGKLLGKLFKTLLEEYKYNPEANGNIRFHYGKLLYLEGHHRKAVRMFKKAREYFSEALPPDHHVFKMLDDMIAEIRQM
jgi:tetratricopeptide (TPR) repeat protein